MTDTASPPQVDSRRLRAELEAIERQAEAARDEAVTAARSAEASRDQCRAALKSVSGLEKRAVEASAAEFEKIRKAAVEEIGRYSDQIRAIRDDLAQSLTVAERQRQEDRREDLQLQAQVRDELEVEQRQRIATDDLLARRVDDTRESLGRQLAELNGRLDQHRSSIQAIGKSGRGAMRVYANGVLAGDAQNVDFIGASVTRTRDRLVVDHSATYASLLRVPTNVTAKTTTYAAAAGDVVLADATTAPWTLTLPAVAAGIMVRVKKTDNSMHAVTVTPASGTIDGAASVAISVQYDSHDFVSDGTNWVEV